MASPLVCVVYVYEQFIQHHYIILSVSLTVEKWQLDGALTDAAKHVRVCVFSHQNYANRFMQGYQEALGHKTFFL